MDREVDEPKSWPPETVGCVVDREREVQQRPAVVRAAPLGLRHEYVSYRPELADRGVFDDRHFVVEDKRSVERIRVGQGEQHRGHDADAGDPCPG